MQTIGIVGGIGAGKSTVVSILKELKKCFVIGADEIGHRILLKGDLAYNQVVQAFGEDILDEEGNIIRRKLGNIVFGDGAKLQILNQITHPIIYKEIEALVHQCKQTDEWDLVIIDAALLIEVGLVPLTDYVIAVYADEGVRIERLMKRDHFTKEQVLDRINKQKKWEELEEVADFIIPNNLTRQHTKEEIEKMLEQL